MGLDLERLHRFYDNCTEDDYCARIGRDEGEREREGGRGPEVNTVNVTAAAAAAESALQWEYVATHALAGTGRTCTRFFFSLLPKVPH